MPRWHLKGNYETVPGQYLVDGDSGLFIGDNPFVKPRRAGLVSLDRALSKLGLASRAEARRLIADGRVTVDGRTVTRPATPIVPEQARISIDGAAPSLGKAARRTLAFHKPRGRSPPGGILKAAEPCSMCWASRAVAWWR